MVLLPSAVLRFSTLIHIGLTLAIVSPKRSGWLRWEALCRLAILPVAFLSRSSVARNVLSPSFLCPRITQIPIIIDPHYRRRQGRLAPMLRPVSAGV